MKTPLKGAREETGSLPGMTGALLKIVKAEKSKTKETAATPGATMYVFTLAIQEPKTYKGQQVRDWVVTGTEDNLKWDPDSRGVARIARLLKRSGTPISDDDEEWMTAMVDNLVVAPITVRETDRGPMNGVGLYYRPTDDDAPAIGLAEEKKGKGAAAAGKAAAAAAKAAAADDDDDDAPPAKPAKKEEEEADEEEAPPKKVGKGKKPKDDDEDDDD